MTTAFQPVTDRPVLRRAGARLASPEPLLAGVHVRGTTWLAGWGGALVVLLASATLIALLVGWVLLWAYWPGGPSVPLLTLGTIAFAGLLLVPVVLVLRLRRQARLRNAEAAFLTAVSHHLRTPLAGIRAAAQTLERPGLEDRDRERLLQAILRETERLSLLVDNVVELARFDVEGGEFRLERLDLGGVVEEAVEGLRLLAASRGGSLDLRVLGPCPVRGDRAALGLLVGNIADNAVKHVRPAPDDAPKVRITVAAFGGFGLVQVADEGAGFDPAEAPRLFRRFTRGDGSRPGAGLGLALARAIARAHGGDVRLESEGKGRGAVAELWIPLEGHAP